MKKGAMQTKQHTDADLRRIDDQIGIEGARAIAMALKVNHTVTSMNLSRTFQSDDAQKMMRQNDIPRMRAENHIGDEGALAIADALHVNQTLATLDLSGDHSSDASNKNGIMN